MSVIRTEKRRAAIQKSAAQFLAREADSTSLITVTSCSVSSDGNSAIVYVSVYPARHQEKALRFARGKRRDAQKYIRSRIRTKRLTCVDFAIDPGEQNRKDVDAALGNEHGGY